MTVSMRLTLGCRALVYSAVLLLFVFIMDICVFFLLNFLLLCILLFGPMLSLLFCKWRYFVLSMNCQDMLYHPICPPIFLPISPPIFAPPKLSCTFFLRCPPPPLHFRSLLIYLSSHRKNRSRKKIVLLVCLIMNY